MAESPLAKKMKLKPGARAAVVGAPDGYVAELEPLPSGATLATSLRGTFDWVQVFARTRAELELMAPRAIRALGPGAVLWVSFPKGSSKIQSDLTRDVGWEVLADADLKWVTLVSVNDTWSAFALRSYRTGEARQTFR